MVSSSSFSTRVLIFLIYVYQKTISLLLGINCRFKPTCSQYAIEALLVFGTIKGGWLILKRILKCHPLNSGGNDPVPSERFNNREY